MLHSQSGDNLTASKIVSSVLDGRAFFLNATMRTSNKQELRRLLLKNPSLADIPRFDELEELVLSIPVDDKESVLFEPLIRLDKN